MLSTNHTHLYFLNGILYRGIVCLSNKLQGVFALGVKGLRMQKLAETFGLLPSD